MRDLTEKRTDSGFFSRLRRQVAKDIRVVFERDPAAKNVWEVVLCYSGLHALWLYRLAHFLYVRDFVLLPRLISNFARFVTGIEIHPGAVIGDGLFIDHGTGIVIGETAILGKNVTLYQGVTLGGTGKEKGKRHPTLGNNVVVATGAKVLGSFTVGDHAKIGAGSVVLKEVPPYATVVGIPGRVVVMNGKRVYDETELEAENDVDLDHCALPDPEADFDMKLVEQIRALEEKVALLEQKLKEKNNNA